MQNVEIQFNVNVVKRVKSYHFNADQIGSILFVLFAMYESQNELLDEFDDSNTGKCAVLLYRELEMRGLIAEDKTATKGKPMFILTKEGNELIEFIKSEFTATNQSVTSTTIAVVGTEQLKESLSAEDPETWIDEWVDIFPRGVKSSGRLLRSDKPTCLRKMKVFMTEYGYNKDTILKATKAYIKSKEEQGFAYTRCAVYFISRTDGSRADKVSDLATWCDQIQYEESQGNTESSENNLEIMV